MIDTAFTWGDDRPPRTPWHKTLIYECHVKGLTMRHPDVPEERRGTYAGWRRRRSSTTCTSLGVTAVELLPVHYHLNDRHLRREGADELLGLQHARLLRAAPGVRVARRRRARACRSSRRWSARSTRRASR